jgi:Flp pilus assembly secretin CpaC
MTAILAGLVLAAAGSDESRRTSYQIDVRITAVRTDATRAEQRVRVLSEPRIVTLSGRPAFFRSGGTRRLDDGIVGPGVVEQTTGFQIEVLAVERSHHRVQLETEILPIGAKGGQRVVLETVSGTKQRFRVPTATEHETVWAEVVVTEVGPVGGR